MRKFNPYSTIQLRKDAKEILKRRKRKGESYEDMMRRMGFL